MEEKNSLIETYIQKKVKELGQRFSYKDKEHYETKGLFNS